MEHKNWHTFLIFFCPRKFLISTNVPALVVVMLIGKWAYTARIL